MADTDLSSEEDLRQAGDIGKQRHDYLFVPQQGVWENRLRSRRPSGSANQSTTHKPGTPKWTTMQHNGPLFPEQYERLPKSVHFFYNSYPVELTEQAEEVATFYAKLLKTPHVLNSTFNQNFFNNFRKCLSEEQRRSITNFELCDFNYIHAYLESDQEVKTLSKEVEEKYGSCLVDGKRHRVPSFRISEPGLVCPRNGFSLTMGMIRPRVLPEDVVINCDEQADPPSPPDGHSWGHVIHDRMSGWLYCYTDVVTDTVHFVYPEHLNLQRPTQREMLDTARRLHQHLPSVRRDYQKQFASEQWLVRQRSVALYCIDKLGLSSDVLDDPLRPNVLGLRVRDMRLLGRRGNQKNVVQFMDPTYTRKVTPEAFYSLSVFVRGKKPHELVFEELTPDLLKEHLEFLMDGLSSKIFRIHNASQMLEERLVSIPLTGTIVDHLSAYSKALKEIKELYGVCYQSKTSRTSSKLFRDVRLKNDKMKSICNDIRPLAEATFGYLDPRITIAWCLRRDIPLKAVYADTAMRRKISWAIKCTTKYFAF